MHTDDTTAIAALVYGYASAIDRGDLDALADYFVDAVLVSPRGQARGRDEVRRWYESVKLDRQGSPRTHHHVFGLTVDVDGDRATAKSFVTVVQHGLPILAGRYHDVFVRTPDRWQFAARETRLDLVGDLSDHVALPGDDVAQHPSNV